MSFDDRAFDVRYISLWPGSPAGIRDAILARCIVATGVDTLRAMSTREVTTLNSMALEAVQAGRMIDFGHWPQAAIQAGGKRGGPLYTQKALAQPFSQPWLFLHTFRGPDNDHHPQYCAYLVSPVDGADGDLDIVELELMRLKDVNILLVGDRVSLFTSEMRSRHARGYDCSVVPSAWRAILPINGDARAEEAAAGNVLDPLMTALLMLNTTGISRETLAPDVKLNRARTKNGKPAIPPYDRVNSALYVTALTASRAAVHGPAGDGHHASPVPHIRRGHFRTYQSGQRSFIHDTLVRVDEAQRAAFKATRSHYVVRGGDHPVP